MNAQFREIILVFKGDFKKLSGNFYKCKDRKVKIENDPVVLSTTCTLICTKMYDSIIFMINCKYARGNRVTLWLS